MFTPKLKEWYQEVKGKNVEIVFVSGDRSPKDMMDYMKESHGDWLATEHESDLSEKLNEKIEVSGIPSLVVLKEFLPWPSSSLMVPWSLTRELMLRWKRVKMPSKNGKSKCVQKRKKENENSVLILP